VVGRSSDVVGPEGAVTEMVAAGETMFWIVPAPLLVVVVSASGSTPGNQLTFTDPPAATVSNAGQIQTVLPASDVILSAGIYAVVAAEPS
jgi:hypothetical protein